MKLRRIFSEMLAASLLVSTLLPSITVTAAQSTGSGQYAYAGAAENVMTGEYIVCQNVSPNAASKLTDNSGMSGLASSIHLHNTDAQNGYYSETAESVIFTFSQVESLGYMYIWNYNAADKLDSGMKDVKIEFTADGKTWKALSDNNITLARALESENAQYGGNSANNLADGNRTPVNFGGVPVKSVRITALSNYGGSGYGLSEVRFFRYKTRPKTGAEIYANAISPSCDGKANNLVNGYGASDTTSKKATVSNNPDGMWYSTAAATDSYIIIDLDGNYPVSEIYFWNYNNPADLASGVKSIRIEYTVEDQFSTSDGVLNYRGGSWKSLGTFVVNQATGSAAQGSGLMVKLNNAHAQNLRITPISNYGGSGFGLSEIRVFAGSGYAVEPAREWTGLFSNEGSFAYQLSGTMPQAGNGWLAADGIYSLNLNGSDMPGSSDASTKTLFMFSDSTVGNFNNYSGTYGNYGLEANWVTMKNHSFAVFNGNTPDPRNIQFYLNTENDYKNIFDRRDWAQELVRVDGSVYAWGMRFNGDWSADSFDLVKFPLSESGAPDLTNHPNITENAPVMKKATIDGTEYNFEFSAALLDNTASGGATQSPDGYIYIYGIKGWTSKINYKSPIVARVTPDKFEDNSAWRYFDGNDWVEDITKCASLDGGEGGVSSEYSVTYMPSGTYAGKYVMTYTNMTMSADLRIAVSDSPYGQFTNRTRIYCCDELYTILEASGDSGIYVYNAKAHPHLSADGELLMSYNINSSNYDAGLSYEDQHPHFVTLFDIGSDAPDEVTFEDGDNLAIGATATSGNYDTENGLTAGNICDGDASTRWAGGEKPADETFALTDTSVTLAFDNAVHFNKIVINWEEGRADQTSKGYYVSYSDDGITWNRVNGDYRYGQSMTAARGVSYTDRVLTSRTSAKYIRITINKSQNKYPPSIWELEVFDSQAVSEGTATENLAYNCDAYAETGSGIASNITDASFGSVWTQSSSAGNESFYVDLGCNRIFDSIVIGRSTSSDKASEVRIFVSSDANTWNEIAVNNIASDADMRSLEIKFNTAVSRYIRVKSAVSGASTGIREFEVYYSRGEVNSGISVEGGIVEGLCEGISNTAFAPFGMTSFDSSDSSCVGTGSTAVIDGKTCSVVVRGDVNGDGLVKTADFLMVRDAYLGKITLAGAQIKGADASGDSKIGTSDFLMIRDQYLQKTDIYV